MSVLDSAIDEIPRGASLATSYNCLSAVLHTPGARIPVECFFQKISLIFIPELMYAKEFPKFRLPAGWSGN